MTFGSFPRTYPVRPTDLAVYLRSRGWSQLDADTRSIAWEKQDESGRMREIVLPLHPGWRDFPLRVAELFAVLSDVEKREPASIVRDLEQVGVDVVRFRAATSEASSDGTISLEDGNLLQLTAYKSLLASACAAVEPKRAYHSRKPKKAVDYAADLRLAQSEVGSYIVRVFSRVGPALESPQVAMPFPDAAEPARELPFARAVTETLSTALQQTQAAAAEAIVHDRLDGFDGLVSAGVSADFCEALGALHDARSISELSIDVAWAPARPSKRPPARRASFSKDLLQVVYQAGVHLRSKGPHEGFDLEGYVVDLTRPDSTLHGTATVYGTVHGSLRKVTFEIWGGSWELASDAMKNRKLVRCEGELTHEGRSFTLRNMRHLRVIDE